MGKSIDKKDEKKAWENVKLYFKKHASEIVLLDKVLSNGMLSALANETIEESVPPSMTQLGLMSVTLMKKAIHLMKPEWDQAELKQIHANDPQGLLHCILYATRKDFDEPITHTNVPALMDWIVKLHSDAGEPLGELQVDGGTVQFALNGIYQKVQVEGARLFHVLHRPSGLQVEIDEDVVVTLDWILINNWSTTEAALQHPTKKRTQPLYDLLVEQHPDKFKPIERLTPAQRAQLTRKRRAEEKDNSDKATESEASPAPVVKKPRRSLAPPSTLR